MKVIVAESPVGLARVWCAIGMRAVACKVWPGGLRKEGLSASSLNEEVVYLE